MNVQIITAFSLYFTILLGIGIFSHRSSKSEGDFVLGNRSLNFWLTALSAHAADMSAWLFMAMPAAIFVGGLPNMWMALGLLLGMYFNWQLVAPRLRTQTEKLKSSTLSTFFEKRFDDSSGYLRIVTAIMTIAFLTCYLSAGLIAMGYLFEALFQMNYYLGISLAISVVIAYTFVGGFIAVAWTDLFQGTFLLVVILLVPLIALFSIGGWDPVIAAAKVQNLTLQIFDDVSLLSFINILFIALGWGLGYFGQPHIITKFMGIRDVKDMDKAKWVGMSWQFLALSGSVFVGLVGIGFFPYGIPNAELVFVDMVKVLFPPFFIGFILCGILAANISTMDSQILVSASVISEDIYKRFFRREATSFELLKVSRVGVVFVGLLSYLIASSKSATVSSTIYYAWSGLGSAFGPLVLTSLYAKRINKYGAFAGIVTGGLVAGVWPLINPYLMTYTLPPMIPGFSLSLIAIFLFSNQSKK